MIKKFLIRFIFFFFFLFAFNVCFARNINLENRCLLPSVRLLSYANKSIGSGVIVKSQLMKDEGYSNIVISCWHVTKDNKLIVEVPDLNNKIKHYYGTAIYENSKYDISVIQFRTDKKLNTAELDLINEIDIDDDVISVGYGLSPLPKLGYGKVITKKHIDKSFKDTFFTNIPMVMGDSGGPVFKDNKLVAISQAIRVIEWKEGLLPFPNISVVMPIQRLLNLNKDESGKLDFVLKPECTPPMFPHLFLQMQEFDKILIK